MGPFPFEWITDKQGLIIEPMQEAVAIVAVSVAQAKQIKTFTGVDAIVIPNVVNVEEFFYRTHQKTGNCLQLVLAGIYDSNKGADYLLAVLPSFINSHPNTILHLVGNADAERMAALQYQIKEAGIENVVKFHGQLTPTALCELYKQCDFYVCASEWESFGLTMLEALFAGLPVVSTNCGGVLEFMNEQNGILISNDRKEATLLNGLLQMTNQLSAFNRKAISATANKQFSCNMIKDKYYSLYKEVLQKADPRSVV
jgi:glycosyltransferase involved in cell wall biosynthesis